MATGPASPSPAPSGHSAPTLPRGGACLPCRRRKMRCDGGKPSCGQCISKGRDEDCEYTSETQGLTRTQMLEEDISLLESRIRELEDPAAGAPSVRLHNPQRAPSASSNLPASHAVPLVATSPSGSRTITIPGASSSSDPAHQAAGLPTALPTVQESYTLINAFVPHASQLGFFLNVPRFMQLAYTPPGQRDHFVESLITTACLWGSRLARNAILSTFESGLLSRAVHLLSGSLFLANTEPRGHGIIGVIQAEVLLSYYFFSLGRFLEGRYHCSAAASLAISCQLNVLGNEPNPRMQRGLAMDLVASQDLGLATMGSADPIQTGERINAFWTVYILDKVWAVALSAPSSITDQVPGGMPLSTPWGLSMEMYEQGHVPPRDANFSPLYAFLRTPCTPTDLTGNTALTLRAKASTLFSRASNLASQFQEDMPNRDSFVREFNTLDNLINAFISSLPQASTIARGESLERLVASTIARVASIQLHIRFAPDQARSRERCVSAATAIVSSVQHVRASQLGFVDPIMAILLTSAAQVIIHELKALTVSSSGTRAPGRSNNLEASFNHILNVMADFSPVCPLMASQASQIKRAGNVVL